METHQKEKSKNKNSIIILFIGLIFFVAALLYFVFNFENKENNNQENSQNISVASITENVYIAADQNIYNADGLNSIKNLTILNSKNSSCLNFTSDIKRNDSDKISNKGITQMQRFLQQNGNYYYTQETNGIFDENTSYALAALFYDNSLSDLYSDSDYDFSEENFVASTSLQKLFTSKDFLCPSQNNLDKADIRFLDSFSELNNGEEGSDSEYASLKSFRKYDDGTLYAKYCKYESSGKCSSYVKYYYNSPKDINLEATVEGLYKYKLIYSENNLGDYGEKQEYLLYKEVDGKYYSYVYTPISCQTIDKIFYNDSSKTVSFTCKIVNKSTGKIDIATGTDIYLGEE